MATNFDKWKLKPSPTLPNLAMKTTIEPAEFILNA